MTFSKLRFSTFEKFVTKSVLGSCDSLNFITSCCNLKSRGLGAKNYVWLFYYFNFEKNYDVLSSESQCILLNKNKKFNKNETVSKLENRTGSFREAKLVLQLI